MNFNGQPNMCFGKIISCTCDLHIKLNILNPLIYFYFLSNDLKNESFALQSFFQNFQNFDIFV